jgi:hypothetical protein
MKCACVCGEVQYRDYMAWLIGAQKRGKIGWIYAVCLKAVWVWACRCRDGCGGRSHGGSQALREISWALRRRHEIAAKVITAGSVSCMFTLISNFKKKDYEGLNS